MTMLAWAHPTQRVCFLRPARAWAHDDGNKTLYVNIMTTQVPHPVTMLAWAHPESVLPPPSLSLGT